MNLLKAVPFTLAAMIAVPTAAHAEKTLADALEAKKIVRLQPTSAWAIDYGESRCRLARIFGPKETPHLLSLEQSAPASAFAVTVAGEEIDPFHGASGVSIGMVDEEPLKKLDRVGSGELGEYGPALILMPYSLGAANSGEETHDAVRTRPAGINLSRAEGATRFVIKRGGRVVSFEAGSLKEPLQALNTCSLSFLEQWGLSAEEHRNYRPAKFENLERVSRVIARAYPRDALQRRESGVFRARLIIERDGSVSDCALDEATITQSLESPACKMLQRLAKFEPAVDEEGNAIRSFYATRIIYSAK